MGCIESIENKFQEMDERFRQIFEADKYFVDNMQMVATCHAFRQEQILCDFQFMQTDKPTRELLRKFMLQLRSIDFVLVGRIMMELCMNAKNKEGKDLYSLENYNIKTEDFVTKDERRDNRKKINQLQGEEKTKAELAELQSIVMEKLCDGYNFLMEQKNKKDKQQVLNDILKAKMNSINLQVNQYRSLDTQKESWQDRQSILLNEYYDQNLVQDFFNTGANGGVKPNDLDFPKFQLLMQKIDRNEEVEEVKCYKQNSYLRNLFLQAESLSAPKVEQHSSTQFRYLYLNQHAYHNYAKYLEDIQKELIDIWEAQYKEWLDLNQDKDVDKRKKQHNILTEVRLKRDELAIKSDHAAQSAVEKEKSLKEEEEIKMSQMSPEKKKTYEEKKKLQLELEKKNALSKRVDAPEDINEQIQKDLEKYLYWVKNKNAVPKLKDVINNPNFFLDDATKYWNRGLKMVAKGRVALVLLAGDSDLKWNFSDEKTPLGFRPTGLNSGKCLFQLFCEKVEAVQRLAHMYRPDRTNFLETGRVHIYVMTNSENDFRIRKLFRKHLNFGLWKINIHFFEQSNFPYIGTQGEIRLRDKLRLMNLPDGTGGFYDAVHNNDLLREWDFLGVKYVHVMGIDNLLARPVDPTLLGMLRGVDGVETGVDIAIKAVQALNAKENLSRLVMQKNGEGVKPSVLRVNEILIAKGKVEEYNLAVYNDFACTVEFVKNTIENKKDWETLHQTTKDYAFHRLDPQTGDAIMVREDSYLFEKDILDALVTVHPKKFAILEVDRKNEYAPVKQANKVDQIADNSFDSAIVQMSLLNFRWLIDHGYQFKDTDFYVKDDLHKKTDVSEIQKILNGRKLETTVYTNEHFKMFIGDKTKEEWDKEQKDKKESADKRVDQRLKARKKKAKREGKSLEEVEIEAPSDDEEQNEEPTQLFKHLVEIDSRQSLHGENIPDPKSYVSMDAKSNVEKEDMPFYLKSNAKPIKFKLPWKLNEIYRYI